MGWCHFIFLLRAKRHTPATRPRVVIGRSRVAIGNRHREQGKHRERQYNSQATALHSSSLWRSHTTYEQKQTWQRSRIVVCRIGRLNTSQKAAHPLPRARGPGASAPTAGKGLWVLVFAGACQGTAWAGLCLIHHHHHHHHLAESHHALGLPGMPGLSCVADYSGG